MEILKSTEHVQNENVYESSINIKTGITFIVLLP